MRLPHHKKGFARESFTTTFLFGAFRCGSQFFSLVLLVHFPIERRQWLSFLASQHRYNQIIVTGCYKDKRETQKNDFNRTNN